MGKIIVDKADLTELEADAIVNPANSSGAMGGGVALAIKRAGGDEIEREAMSKAPIPVGEAVMTTGGKLKARAVIHAPTMERPAMRIGPENARIATRAALELAKKHGLRSIAFPGMGTGVGGVSHEEAAKVMAEEIEAMHESFDFVWLVALDDDLVGAFRRETA